MTFLDRILRRRGAYRACFLDESEQPTRATEIVMADLKKFCRASTSTATVSPVSKGIDPIAMALAEGRREVWLRIQQYLNLDERIIQRLKEEPDA